MMIILPLAEAALTLQQLHWQQLFMQMPARSIQMWTEFIRQTQGRCLDARKLKEITYDEMLDLATLGAGVLHNRSVEMAKKYGVPLVVRSSLNDSEGTVVKEVTTVERMLISGVALDTDAVRIAVIGIKDMPGMAFKVFDTLAKKKINVDVILQSIGRAGTKDISFTVNKDDLEDAVATPGREPGKHWAIKNCIQRETLPSFPL